MKIVEAPFDRQLKKWVYSQLNAHSLKVMGEDGLGEIFSFMAIACEERVGIIAFQPFWGALHIKYLWVKEERRKEGIATKLMLRALEWGKIKKLLFAFVETMSFQAFDFYKKMGFHEEFVREGFVRNLSFHYLRKDLQK